MADTTGEVMTTADGTPLKVSLARALRRQKINAVLLVLPLFLYLAITFTAPILDMLYRSLENSIVQDSLPRTVEVLESWNPESGEVPGEEAFAAMREDLIEGKENFTNGSVARRLNRDRPGVTSLFRKSARYAQRMEPPYKAAFLDVDKDWGDVGFWSLLKRESDTITASYYLAAIDMKYNDQGEIVSQPEYRQIYVTLFIRTLVMSFVITLLCILLGYPVSYLLATLPMKTSSLLMIMVLLPFWTSLLVRTTSWIALLQQEGVINDLLVWLGVINDDNRFQLIFNKTGTTIAMTHILLPFMILPLYSVMRTIPGSYMRAARSLGANPLVAFVRVYMPNTVAGVGAGSILVFILAIGYYITPALVGGQSGTFISNFIANHISVTLNWGLAAALGVLLLAIVMILYFLYDKIVGIDNMKLG